MGLYSSAHVMGRLAQNRCVKSNELLLEGEAVFCRHCFQSLYQNGLLPNEKKQIQALIESLLESSDHVKDVMHSDAVVAGRLRDFFGILLSKGSESLELFVHAYMFLFWELLDFPVSVGVPQGRLYWMAKNAPDGTSFRHANDSSDLVIKRLAQEGVEVDLAAVDANSETLWLLEIKRADLDDRAVGQMIRYFDRAVHCLSSREFRAANINFVRPVIVLELVDPKRWVTIPLHFRELLDIYSFKATSDAPGHLVFSRVRKQLLSADFRR